MKRILNKINSYKKEHGMVETINWILNCVAFKLRKLKPAPGNFLCLKLSNAEKKFVVSKNNQNVFIFGNVPYYDIGGGQRSSQLAKSFNKMGFPVYYIYGFKSNESKINNIPIPTVMHSYIGKVKIDYFKKIVCEGDICIFEAPCKKYLEYIKAAKHNKAKVVYENIDNWETSLGKAVFDKSTLEYLLKESDLLIGTAKPLVNQLKNYCNNLKINKEVLYLPNAVDDEMFFPLKKFEKPFDLILGTKTLLYYGSLWGNWFDWNLVFDLAVKHPDYTVNLIGDCKGINHIISKAPKNLKFLGIKKQSDLPAYLKFSDYALLPFKVGEISDYVSPLKLFEYIAMNKIVISTNLPDIQDYPNTYFGDTVAEWDKHLISNYKINEESTYEFVYNNNWNNRVCLMLDKLFDQKKDKCNKEFYKNISIVVLNYNNKEIIDRCIDSLLFYNKRYDYEIIVVDNGSTDGSYEQLETKYENKIKLLRNKTNGCSSGRNLGVKSAKYDYILFLDSDQWAMNYYWIDPYFEVIKNASNIGLIGWTAGFFNKYGTAYHVVDSFPHRYMPSNGLYRYDIGYLGSGGMLLNKKLFNKVGGFDENYDPTCYEDTDFSLLIRDAGYEIYYCPYLGIMHLPHQTTKSGSESHKKLLNEKKDYFKNKWKKKNKKLLKMFIK